MDYSFFTYLLSLIFGLCTGYYDMKIIVICLSFIFCLLLILKNIKVIENKKMIILVMIMIFGYFRYKYADSSSLRLFENKEVTLEGYFIEKLPSDSYILKIKKINNNRIKTEKIKVNIRNLDKEYKYKDSIKVRCLITLPLENTNPLLFNYKNYLLSKNIFTISNIENSNIKYTEHEEINIFEEMRLKFTKYIENKLDLSLDSPNNDLMKGIILGKTSYIDKDIKNIYRELGIAHILAISGLHINILSAFICKICKLIKISKKGSYISSNILIWIYVYMVGAPASILRAAIMMTITIVGKVHNKPYSTIRNISTVCFCMLILNPFYIFDLGFILSFMATISVNIINVILRNNLSQRYGKVKEIFLTGLSIYLGVGILDVYFFNNLKLLSILSNTIIIPIVSLALVITFLLVITPSYLNIVVNILGFFINYLLWIQFKLVNIFNIIDKKTLVVATPSVIFIIYYYTILYYLMIGSRSRKNQRTFFNFKYRRYKAFWSRNIVRASYLCLIFISLFELFILVDKINEIRISFIDVGQGDCALIEYNNKSILIDTGGTVFGNFQVGENITKPYLEKHGIKRLDAIFISHFDADHCQALHYLIDKIKINVIYCSYQPPEKYKKMFLENGIDYIILNKGDLFKIGKNLRLEVIWPRKDINENMFDSNDKSMVMSLKAYNKEVLFTGDISEKIEKYLCEELINHDIDILKVPHHGSDTSSSLKFIQKTSPNYAIISVGRKNRFNHPSEEVVKRYYENGIKIFRTDKLGRIKVVINKEKMKIFNFKEESNNANRKRAFYETTSYYLLYFSGLNIIIYIEYSKEEDFFGI